MSEDESRSEYEERHEKRDLDLLKSHATRLAEHFESVQIFCTRHMPSEVDGTITAAWGEGNWFARYGSVREWVVKEEERMRVSVRPTE